MFLLMDIESLVYRHQELIEEVTLPKLGISLTKGLFLILNYYWYILVGSTVVLKATAERYKISVSDWQVFLIRVKNAPDNQSIEKACEELKGKLISAGTYDLFIKDLKDRDFNKQVGGKIRKVPAKDIVMKSKEIVKNIEYATEYFLKDNTVK